MKMDLPYIVINPAGDVVLQSIERYPRRVELDLLEWGYTIKLNGRKLTKSEIRKEVRANV